MTNTLSEEVFLASGKLRELPLEEKVKKSFERASVVAVGKFKLPDKAPKLETFSKEEAFVRVEFHVEKIIKGEKVLKGDVIKLKLPIFVREGKGGSPSLKVVQKEVDSAKEMSQKLERSLEGKLIDRQTYDKELLKARDTLLASGQYLKDYVLVPIKVGGLDAPYRSANVLVTTGKTYILFLFKEKFDQEDAAPFFPWELDLYPGSEERVTQVLNRHL